MGPFNQIMVSGIRFKPVLHYAVKNCNCAGEGHGFYTSPRGFPNKQTFIVYCRCFNVVKMKKFNPMLCPSCRE